MAANIALEKTDHPAVRKFLNERVKNGGAIPGANQLREQYVQDVIKVEKGRLFFSLDFEEVASLCHGYSSVRPSVCPSVRLSVNNFL